MTLLLPSSSADLTAPTTFFWWEKLILLGTHKKGSKPWKESTVNTS